LNSTASIILFWVAALIMLAAVLAWILPSLFRRTEADVALDRRELNIAVYRDQYRELENDHRSGLLSGAQKDVVRRELEVRLARDALQESVSPVPRAPARPAFGMGVLAMVPALALGLYLVVGEPGFVLKVAAADQAEEQRQRKMQEALERLEAQVGQALAELEQAVRDNPDDGIAWTYLANAHIARDGWEEAESAYARAYELLPENAAVLSGYAETLAVNAGRDLSGRPIELVREALLLDPMDQKALELAGIHAYQNEEFTTASYHWNQALQLLPEDSPAYAELAAMVRSARIRGHVEAFGGAEMLTDPAAVIRGRVELAPELVGAAKAEDTVFLIARTLGGGIPLATLSTRMDQLPVDFVLDDGLINDPEHLLSKYESITLVARISSHGDARARPGDLEGVLESVRVGSRDVRLVIDTVRP